MSFNLPNLPIPTSLKLPEILDVKSVNQWSNYSGTINDRIIPLFCTPKPVPDNTPVGTTPGALKGQASAVNAILEFCFTNQTPLRAMGSRWSFSSIIEPKNVILDTPNLNSMLRITPDRQTDAYKASRGAQGFVPCWIMGGTGMADINRRLIKDFPDKPLCLQTSGAADGQRIAGVISTGTHGAAVQIGAVHDTVLAIHLLVAPGEARLIQSGSNPALNDSFVSWLQEQTGIPTTHIKDDDLLAAAQVSLGSMGIIFSVVIETEPAYKLLRHTKWFNSRNDPQLWAAIKALDSSAFYPNEAKQPYHFEVLFNPYPVKGRPEAFLTLMWKKPAGSMQDITAALVEPAMASDTMSFISRLVSDVDGKLTGRLVANQLGCIIDDQVHDMFGKADGSLLLPGKMFGPTNLPKGTGASTEIVINATDTERTVRAMWDVFNSQSTLGKHLLGAMSLRFVPASKAHLAMNIHPMNCFIELPSIKNPGVLDVYTAVWNRLEKEGIPFTCHWGQLSGMNESRLKKYFQGREEKWNAARAKLLDATGRKVFAAPLLAQVGLE
jgi:hypothetical protein